MKFNLLHILCIIAIFQSFLVSIFLITNKKGIKESNLILSAWLFIFAVMLTCNFLVSDKIWQYFNNYHKIIFVVNHLSFLLAPLFYFYIKTLLTEDAIFKKQDILHVLPFVLVTLYTIIKLISIPRFVIWGTFIDFFCDSIYLIQNLIYLFFIMRMLKNHGLSIRSFFQHIHKIQVAWIKFLLGGYIILWIAKFQSFFFWLYSRDGTWCTYTATTYFMASFIFFNTILFFALKKPEIFLQRRKYEKSILSDDAKMQYKKRLIHLMETKKPYLNMTLNLNDLAHELSIPIKYLSQVINESIQQTFYEFVNSYRVMESKRLLQNPNYKNITILEIAYESGFNTKATFNSAFKKFTGLTPKEYRKKYSVNIHDIEN